MIKNILFAIIIANLLFSSCGQKATKPAEITQVEEAIPVKTTLIAQKNSTTPIHASGFLTSKSEQRLGFKIGGVISKIYVKEGDLVKAGQLLATLDLTEINGQVALAQQGLKKATRDLERVEGLYKDSAATLELLQNATTGRDVAKENVGIATFNQKFAEIRAKESGKVIKKIMNEGEIVGPGMPLFVIFGNNAKDWIVKINVSDRDWAALNVGMAAQIKMDAYPDTKFAGKISELAPTADPTNGLYPIEINIAAQGKRFSPGLFASVDITPIHKSNQHSIPIEAIVEGEGKNAFVYAIADDGISVRKVPISIAYIEGNQAILNGSIENVQEIVTAGSPYLTERSKVRVIK
jgi:membrane fusion protein, multidrug efflux system